MLKRPTSYSLEGKHLWYRVLKCVTLLEIHVCATIHRLCLVYSPPSFVIWLKYNQEILQILLLVKLNWLVFCDIKCQLCNRICKMNKIQTHATSWFCGTFFSATNLNKNWWITVGSAECKFIFFSLDRITVHRRSCQKESFSVAACKFLMLLRRGTANSLKKTFAFWIAE